MNRLKKNANQKYVADMSKSVKESFNVQDSQENAETTNLWETCTVQTYTQQRNVENPKISLQKFQ